MTKINSSPNIRFRNFTNAWEQRKLGEVVDIRSGKDYKHLSKGNIPVYGTGGYMLSVDKALSYKEDSIGIGRKGTIDKPYILRAPFWTVDTLFYAVPETNNDLDFIYDIFQNINWRQKDESTGVPSLSKTAISDIDIFIPEYKEQQEIGTFFKNLDNLITLHQRKLEQLQLLKKTFSNKMFPGVGERIPDVRFKDYYNYWKKFKLKSIFKKRNEKGSTELDFVTVLLNDTIVRSDAHQGYGNSRDLSAKRNAKIIRKNDYLIDLTSYERGFFMANIDGLTSSAYTILQTKQKTSYDYWRVFFTTHNFIESLKKYTPPGARQGKMIEVDHVINKSYRIPELEEQKQIGLLFKEIDNLITFHQRKLELLEMSKKYYLKHMFV